MCGSNVVIRCAPRNFNLGLKKGLSTTQCTFSMLEIINYFNFNNSNVNVLMLDASKAFDRVKYCKLFAALLEHDISPIVWRLLLFMYTNQSLRESGVTLYPVSFL